MSRYTANADYQERDREPMRIEAGTEVTVGPSDSRWPGWVWAVDREGRRGYVPESILEPLGEGVFAAMEAFDPTVLAVKRGDELDSEREVHGWHWCRNQRDERGWVPGYLLQERAE